LYHNTTGFSNTAVGYETLFNNNGNANTANGAFALHENADGPDNTAMGYLAMYGNVHGGRNTATGSGALRYNTSGTDNTATGDHALFNNNAGENVADGASALYENSYGNDNVAVGEWAMKGNSVGSYNVAVGAYALSGYGGTGILNTSLGYNSMPLNTGGTGNSAVGDGALGSNTTGNYNIGIGNGGGYYLDTGSNNIDIGNYGVAGDDGVIRIGTTGTNMATFVAGISGTAVTGDTVVVDANGQLGVLVSSERFKNNITPMNNASEAIYSLKPVTFHYKCDIDPKDIPQFGLIAEQVAKVNSDLVSRDRDGKPYTVRYAAVNAMLLNEFLKEHRQVQEQQKQIEKLAARLEEQAEQIRKVNDKLEMNRPAPQMAVNDR